MYEKRTAGQPRPPCFRDRFHRLLQACLSLDQVKLRAVFRFPVLLIQHVALGLRGGRGVSMEEWRCCGQRGSRKGFLIGALGPPQFRAP